MSCLSIFWIKNCRRWSFATLAVLHSINNHHLHPGRMKEKEVGRPKVFSSFCQCTMYDFHNSSYIFEKTKPFASFCSQRASWIYSKNRFPWGLKFKKIRPLAYSFYVDVKEYKICPKMWAELWKLYIVPSSDDLTMS